MKFRRCMSMIYSSALVLGLSFLFYPQSKETSDNKDKGVVNSVTAPTKAATATPTVTMPVASDITAPSATQEPVTTQAPTVTSVPDNNLPPILTNNTLTAPLSGVKDLVTSYINAYYKNDFETVSSLVTDATMLNATLMESNSKNVAKVEDLQLYSKPGIDGVFSIVYATYSLYYNDLQLSVPYFSEYYVKRLSDGSYRIITTPISASTRQAFFQARKSEAVLKLSISSLIKRYHAACLAASEPLLAQCVTNPDYLDLEYIASRYSVTEAFTDYDFLLYPGINEFEYIVFVTHNEKIVFSNTPAPCIEYYYIDLDDSSGYPAIYLGITSLDTDAYCAAVTQEEEIQALAKKINTKMQEALVADDDLKEFYQLLLSNSSEN